MLSVIMLYVIMQMSWRLQNALAYFGASDE